MPKPKKKVPEFNAAPMADISFLLLIFFLVATTMNVDTGILRKLPPYQEEPEDTPPIKERNVFIVLLNRNNQLMVEGEIMDISQLADRTKEFIRNPNNKENLSAKKTEEVPYFGEVRVSKGVVSLQNDRGTEYGEYIKVQNELMKAFNELRNELAMDEFGKKYEELSDERKKAIRKIYPLSISEAEPKNVGGD